MNSQNPVYLEEETHTYYNRFNPNIQYYSVTQMIGMYEQEFEAEYHSKRVAERDNKTQQQVLDEWQHENDKANQYGSYVHKIMENYLLSKNQMYVPKNDFERDVIKSFQDLNLVKNEVKPECVLNIDFTDEIGLAGTADIIEKLGRDKFNVWDFKTNKKIRFMSEYNDYFKFPVQHLSQCEYNIYSLQLSVYAYMFEKRTGRKLGRMGLIYFDKRTKTFTFYPVIYLKREVEMVLDHFKNWLFNDK